MKLSRETVFRIFLWTILISVFLCKKGALAEEKLEAVIWDKEISLGYNLTTGNTETSQLSASIFLNRKIEKVNEITLRSNIYYSSSGNKMDSQKWFVSGRYAFSEGKRKKWYNFYRLEYDHDRFANIDYRIVPATGLGFWFSDLVQFKALVEGAVGLEHTDYRDNTRDDYQIVLIPRAFIEKPFWETSRISENIYLYNAMDEFSEYRLHSETAFSNSLNEKLSLRLSLIIDYDSEPSEDIKKTDLRFISSLTYSF